jgi:hypothetical protein
MFRVGRELVLGALWVVWLGGIAAGFAVWEAYESTPGDAPQPAPTEHPAAGPWRLVMFVHPHCPCARASLGELRSLLAECPADVTVRVLFVRPVGVAEGWERGELWDAATEVPGVRVECDAGGAEARRAGATTSGHVVLYDAAGAVAFRGGITRARGRVGDSPGRRAVADILRGESGVDRAAPVFGCPLFANCGDEDTGTCPR